MVRLSGIEKLGMGPKTIDLKLLGAALAGIILIEALCAAMGNILSIRPLALLGGTRLLQSALLVGLGWSSASGLSVIGLSRPHIARGLKRGLLWSAGFGAVAAIGGIFLYFAGTNPLALLRVPLPPEPVDQYLYFAVGGVIAPVAEELFFRGILYGFLRRWGVAAAIVLSTTLFGLAHPGVSPVQLIGGVVFAWAYEQEKSLMTPMVIHCLGNLAIFSLALL
jgi:membrane protease YdiL (CAAX protease family)